MTADKHMYVHDFQINQLLKIFTKQFLLVIESL